MSLVDSSVWVALFLSFDTNHKKAQTLLENLNRPLFIPYSVILETATVLTYKHSKKQAENFIDYITGNQDIILLNNDINEELNFFKAVEERLSFTDASLIYLSRKLKCPIATFDKQLKRVLKKL